MNVEQHLRKEFLTTVEGIVNNDRASQYGGAEDSFLAIASFWTIYLRNKGILADDKVVIALDVALMMDLMKTARLTANPMHYDSWLDKAGYAACGGSLVGHQTKATPSVENYYPVHATNIEGGMWRSINTNGNGAVCVGEKGLLHYAMKHDYHALRMQDGTIWRRVTGLDFTHTKKKEDTANATASKPSVPTDDSTKTSPLEGLKKILEAFLKVDSLSEGSPHLVGMPKAEAGQAVYQFTEALHTEEGWLNLVSEGFLESDWLLTKEQAIHAMNCYGNMLALRTGSGGNILTKEAQWNSPEYSKGTAFVYYRKKAGKNVKSVEELTNGNNSVVNFAYDEALRYMQAHGVYSLVTLSGRELLHKGVWIE